MCLNKTRDPLWVFLLLVLFYGGVNLKCYAQDTTTWYITGTVVDEAGAPLPGATVRIKGTKYGTATDIDGKFSIKCTRGQVGDRVVVTVHFIGMKKAERVWQEHPLQVVLLANTEVLSDLVVEARTNINDLDLRAKSGVISHVDMQELQQKPMIDLSMALQGSVPGLTVINRGELGVKPEIRIRGNSSFRSGDAANEPLYVLDGKVISSQAFLTLNPLDIREIKVLKDAAASALYGVKAANGVIEMTSRRGVPGPLNISITSNIGITLRGRRPVEMMKTEEKLELERLVQGHSAPGYILSPDFYESVRLSDLQNIYHTMFGLPFSDNREEYAQWADAELQQLRAVETDWFTELMRNNLYQSHNLALRGGSDEVTYYVSANYSYQGGQLPQNKTQRISLLNSLDWKTKFGYISLSTNAAYAKIDTPNGTHHSPQSLIYALNPYESRETKALYSFPGYAFSDLMNQYRKESADWRVGTTLTFNLKPISDLLLDASFGVDFLLSESEAITPANSPLEQRRGKVPILRGAITADKDQHLNYTSNIRATFHRLLDDRHDVTVSLNTDYYYTRAKLLSVSGHGIGQLESLAGVNKAKGSVYAPDFIGHNIKTAQIGFGASFGYTYDATYDLFAAYKADASSLLPKEKRWSHVWALGAGVRLDQVLGQLWTSFEEQKLLTKLRLKGSLGSTASLGGVSASLALPVFSYDPNGYYGNHFRELKLVQMYNEHLSPEQVNNYDLGLEVEALDKYQIGVQLYRRDTHNALLNVTIPSSNGFTNMLKNVGHLRNDGLELTLSGRMIDQKELHLFARTSLAYNRSLVVDLYEGDAIYTDADAIFPEYEVGQPYDALYALHSLGVNPLFGYPVFKSKSGEEKPFYSRLTRDDFHNVGFTTPPYQGSLSLNFSWRHLDIDTQFYFVFGGKKPYSMAYVRDKTNVHKNAIAGQVERTWFKPGDDGKLYPSPNSSQATYQTLSQYANTRMIAPSDYLRMTMLNIRYRVPSHLLELWGGFVKYASFSLQVSNLFTLSPYRGSSPESGTFDIGVQPVYTFNLNVNL